MDTIWKDHAADSAQNCSQSAKRTGGCQHTGRPIGGGGHCPTVQGAHGQQAKQVKNTWPWERTDLHSKKTCIYVDDIFRGWSVGSLVDA